MKSLPKCFGHSSNYENSHWFLHGQQERRDMNGRRDVEIFQITNYWKSVGASYVDGRSDTAGAGDGKNF